ncbi:MFS transporter [Buchnera aphidicola (Hyperomyzus lactucae)]|uniref:MFS transporter n=1 Tax=Buchnera aphidicola (Hyperomyzus lactucae) TaxID=1241860 RepID=A0A4D6Y5Q6_9GAMM|nr:MFS transporter [Buchnera aphidicola]QCI21290.1 MFS transporter [Buchnera aphidicola (Hyperomyzus lactucae)]
MILLNNKKEVLKKQYIKKNTKQFNRVILALFSGGFSTFSILYCVQSILPIFSKQFYLTPAESSLSLSAATITMALGMLFTGPLSDVVGRKIIMCTSLFIAALLTIICSMMTSWNTIVLLRSLTGLALSGVVAVAMTYISEEIHPNSLSLCMGLYISGNTIGGCSGRLLTSIVTENFSWNIALMIIGFFSLISSCVFLYFLPNSKNFHSISIDLRNFLNLFYAHLKNPALLVLFIIGFILMGSFVTIFNYIGYRLILEPFLLCPSSIGLLSIIYLTGVYSSPKAGILINKYHRNNILITSLILMILGVFITQYNQLLIIILGLIIFSGGFFASHSTASSWIGSYTNTAKVQATSLYLFFYYLGSSVFGTFGGFFWFHLKWSGISCFIIIMLSIGIFLSFRLKKINS